MMMISSKGIKSKTTKTKPLPPLRRSDPPRRWAPAPLPGDPLETLGKPGDPRGIPGFPKVPRGTLDPLGSLRAGRCHAEMVYAAEAKRPLELKCAVVSSEDEPAVLVRLVTVICYGYNPQVGLFTYIVNFFYDFGSFDMLGSGTLAPWAIVIVDTWMWTPFTMLICLAGLRSIPGYLYEAAEVDRASKWQQFVYITLPSVLPFLLLALLFRGIENFKMFDMVMELTGGGPGSMTELTSMNLKREAFEKWKTGYSSAYAVILFVTIFGFGNVYVKVMNKIKDR